MNMTPLFDKLTMIVVLIGFVYIAWNFGPGNSRAKRRANYLPAMILFAGGAVLAGLGFSLMSAGAFIACAVSASIQPRSNPS